MLRLLATLKRIAVALERIAVANEAVVPNLRKAPKLARVFRPTTEAMNDIYFEDRGISSQDANDG